MKICSTHILSQLVLIFLLSVIGNNHAKAQVPLLGPEDLYEKVKDMNSVWDVMKVAEDYFKGHQQMPDGEIKTRLERFYKKWKRWEHEALIHCGPGGIFVNVQDQLWQAHKEVESGAMVQQSTTPTWQFVGPFESGYPADPPKGMNGIGRCDRIAFHPTNPSIVYIGAPNGGLWRTNNNGSTWTNLTSFLPVAGVSGIVVDWFNPNIIYILTGNGDDQRLTTDLPGHFSSAGIFRSMDGGINWDRLPLPWENLSFGIAPYQLKQSPVTPGVLLAATSYGLYRTGNAGLTWSRVLTNMCFDVDFVPGTNTVYAAINNLLPIRRSVDGGLNFTSISFGPAANTPIDGLASRISLAVTNTVLNPNTELIYVFAGPVTGTGTFRGLYKTGPDGFIFKVRSSPNLFAMSNSGNDNYDQSTYDNCITVKPTNANLILTGGAAIFKSTNGGFNVDNAATYDEDRANFDLSKYVHGDIHDLAYNPLNNYLYAANDGGVSYSTNDGFTWINITKGITTSMFYGIAGVESNQHAILGGLQDNGNKYRGSNTNDFTHIGAFDGYYSAISPSNPNRGYYSSNHFLLRTNQLGSGTYQGINPQASSSWAFRMNTDILDGDFLYASTSPVDSLFTSNNGGDSWFRKQNVCGNKQITTCPTNANRVYILGGTNGANNALRRTDDKGVSWSTNLLVNGSLPAPTSYLPNDVAVSPTNSLQVFICYAGKNNGNKVFYSPDGGLTWNNISFNLPNIPMVTIAIDNQNNVYAGTHYGVYFRRNGESAWYYYSNGLPRVLINDLIIHRGSGTLYAATYGRGIWRTSVATSPCSDNFHHLGGNITGEWFLEGKAIWSNATLDNFQGTIVNLKATDSVLLYANFLATSDVKEFRAYTAPCGTGYPIISNGMDSSGFDLKKAILPISEEFGNFPYGTIRVIKQDQTPKLELHVITPGEISISLHDAGGKFIKNILPAIKAPAGKQMIELRSLNIGNDLHYIHYFHNGVLVHYQEYGP